MPFPLSSPRLSSKRLAELCHRLAIELDAGIDIRRVWQREAELASGTVAAVFGEIRDAVAAGETLSLAMARQGRFFPRLLLEMVEVGDKTGMLVEVFRRLEQHYRHQADMRRSFLAQIAWPMLQLAAALFVVGLLILIMGILGDRPGAEPIDVLGIGLVGTSGLLIYINFILVVALGIAGLIMAIGRDMPWTRPLQHWAMKVPFLGPPLEKLALARLAWALHLTLNVEMDLRRLVPLVLRATGNDYYVRHTDQIVAAVAAGHPLHVAFAGAGVFPANFLDALEVADESGQIVESMGRLSRRYQDEAESAMKTLSTLAGFVVWALVATLITIMIFRLASIYLGAIEGAGRI